MADDDGEVIARKLALNAEEGAGLSRRIAVLKDVGFVERLCQEECLGIVDEGTVNTAFVGAFDVYVFVASLLHARLSHEVVERLVVFNLTHTDDACPIG